MDQQVIASILCIPQAHHAWDTSFMETWRDRAKTRMRELGISQERLAEHFSMTPAGMQKWLAGARQPTFEEINQIADHLEVAQTWLTYGVDPNDSTDGLPPSSKAVIRRLIKLERSGAMTQKLWDAIESIANLTPQLPEETAQVKSSAETKNGTTD
ncbi:helix-turn-helix domain-containing protein [Delftia lacustris]|uniref:helix-turn-helix domain-containing protein n=2 Tax=Delftia TaxID=80865 RepID=UPI001FCAD4C9|nr:helix-turn-helix transcriptional regulator [Delftia lacustris]